jgi:hypothetical protein
MRRVIFCALWGCNPTTEATSASATEATSASATEATTAAMTSAETTSAETTPYDDHPLCRRAHEAFLNLGGMSLWNGVAETCSPGGVPSPVHDVALVIALYRLTAGLVEPVTAEASEPAQECALRQLAPSCGPVPADALTGRLPLDPRGRSLVRRPCHGLATACGRALARSRRRHLDHGLRGGARRRRAGLVVARARSDPG